MRRFIPLMAIMGLLLIGLAAVPAKAQADTCETFQGSPEAAAPDFPPFLDWINVDGELTLDDLEGKIVLLDFWTYGCINCLHMIPVIEQLEEKYPDELVVIGVHSAKFANEGETENIREIVQRYEMQHPVINDFNFDVWGAYRRFGVNAWPTFAVIDPRGNLFAVQPGEIPYEAFDRVIGTMASCFEDLGELDTTPIANIAPELADAPPRILNYPGKVLADAEGSRLFIADSVNHRLVIADLATYEVQAVIGSGERGYADGDYQTAQFYKPQGMALQGDFLYVADTFNHTVRAVDLAEETVMTIAGTGVQGRGIPRLRTFPALATDLRSPWDVEFGADPNILYIAMAGTHQIWQMDLETASLSFFIGNGREAQFNDTLADSELAQPSGLYYVDGRLYFADSESSTIRVADIEADRVQVASGTTENSLFTFGDDIGEPGESLLQHALGVDGNDAGTVWIADTYNSKIKVLDEDGYITDFFTGGEAGYADGSLDEARFNEPGGLSYVDGRLFIADTNNHAIRVVDLEAETVSTVTFPNPQALQIADRATVIAGNAFTGAETLAGQTVSVGEGVVTVDILLPEGYKINDLAPSILEVSSDGEVVLLTEREIIIDETSIEVPVRFTAGEGALVASADLYYCEAVNESLCFIERFAVEIPVTAEDDADTATLSIEREVVPPSGFANGIG